MKLLIVTGSITLPEISDEELAEIYEASGEADIIHAKSAEEALQYWPDAEVALGTLDRATFLTAKKLEWLHSVAAGADMLMFDEMVESEVHLTGEKGLVGEHLGDHAFALLLTLTRNLMRPIREVPHIWHLRPILRKTMIELSGSTLGIVGFGGTGRAVARRARAFAMDVLAVDLEDVEGTPECPEVWKMDRFHEMLSMSDVVVICCPITKQTEGLFDDAAFDAMKDTAYLINVTRGPIVDLGSAERALTTGKIAGAGLDVTPVEPLPEDNVLYTLPNVVVTPHTAGASQFRAHRNVSRFIANLRHWRKGEPLEGVIDKQKGF